jgi:hypothetical protein
MPSISKVFNIPEDYTLEQLKSSYITIIENLSKSDRSDIEKDLLSDQYKKLYKQGKQLYLERVAFDTELEPNDNTHNNNNNYNNNNTSNLHDRFDEFRRLNPFEMAPYNFGYSRYPPRRYYDPFTTFDNVFGQMMNHMGNLDYHDNVDKLNITNKPDQKDQTSNPNIKSQVYSYSSSYRSTSNPDGSRTIIESKSESKNRDNKKTINAYKKMPDGKIIPLTDSELKQIESTCNNDLDRITN